MDCQKCGKPIASNAAFCEYCGQPVSQEPQEPVLTPETEAVPAKKPENLITGIVGALIGAALGGGAIILLSQLGYVASISGLILAVCTLKGYELLGGHLNLRGILICVALILVTPYIADRLDWAIVVADAYAEEGVTFGEAFAAIPMLIEEGVIEMSEYLKNLLMIYGFAALGAFSTLRGLFKKK